jgi:hypothetical protein|tara:strand:- start:584 stop:772 length:189 start_codon:yes stop_codon:yes gene_type:complete
MTLIKHTAKFVSNNLPKDSDRYDQIWAIKQELIKQGKEILATDRETIDSVLDVLFKEYKFSA